MTNIEARSLKKIQEDFKGSNNLDVTDRNQLDSTNPKSIIALCKRIRKSLKTIRKRRFKAVKQLRNHAASTIRTVSKVISKLINMLFDVKEELITAVLRKTDRAQRQVQQYVKLEQYSTNLMQQVLRTTHHSMHSELTNRNLSRLPINLADRENHCSQLLLQLHQIENRQQQAALQGERSKTLIAPQLLELVTALQKPIKKTCEKLRTLTITGQIILSIGGDASSAVRQASAYDPVSRMWTQVCPMHHKRYSAAATSWNGKVVVSGGRTDKFACDKTVEEFDSLTNSWRFLGDLLLGRKDHALVTVNDRIYALGGDTGRTETESVETLDLNATQWTNAPPMSTCRRGLVAVAVQSCIIVAGGYNSRSLNLENQIMDACEKFDVELNKWITIGSLSIPRQNAAAAATLNSVFVFGGFYKEDLDSVEQYDLITDKWTVLQARLNFARSKLAAACLNNEIYVIGGCNNNQPDKTSLASERFDATELQFINVPPAPLHASLSLHSLAATSVLLSAGHDTSSIIGLGNQFILCVGGFRHRHYLSSVEAYVPANDTWYTLSQMPTERMAASATTWNNTVVVAGGEPESTSVQQYDMLTNAWTIMPNLQVKRRWFSLVNLDGNLLAIGGSAVLHSVELFDVDARKWKMTSSLNSGRSAFATAVLQHKVIVAGGLVQGSNKTCETFDLTTMAWRFIAPLNEDRRFAAAASDGNAVYVFGGYFIAKHTVTRYDPIADEWTLLTGRMPVRRCKLAIACVNSYIYLIGGIDSHQDFPIESTDCLKPDRRHYCSKASLPRSCCYHCAVSVDVSDEALFKVLLPLL